MITTPRTDPELAEVGVAERIHLQRPAPPPIEDIARYYALSEERRHYSNGGPCHQQLSARIAADLDGVHVVPVANCTLGLMAALRSLCEPPTDGRRLIAMPAFTFTATACAVVWAGYEPLFIDIDPTSWQMGGEELAAGLARHRDEVAGILGCSTFGSVAPDALRVRWRELADAASLPLLIDSAAGFGAETADGRRAGALGDTEVFSFHATKPFAVGEGGAIVTPDAELAERLRRTINFGMDPHTRVSVETGFNAKMSELIAAAALAMFDRFEPALEERRETARRIRARLDGLDLSFQAGSDGSTWQMFQVAVGGPSTRAAVLDLAERHNIEVRTYFDPPLHRHPAFSAAPRVGELAATDALAARMLSLPMANRLGPRQLERIERLMRQALPC